MGLKRNSEANQILGGRIAATRRCPAVRKRIGIRTPAVRAILHVADRAARNDLFLGQRGCESHPGRLKDAIANVVVVTATCDLFDHFAEQQKSIVAVFPAAAGFEFQISFAIQLHVVAQSAQFQPMRAELRAEDVAGSAGVREQV